MFKLHYSSLFLQCGQTYYAHFLWWSWDRFGLLQEQWGESEGEEEAWWDELGVLHQICFANEMVSTALAQALISPLLKWCPSSVPVFLPGGFILKWWRCCDSSCSVTIATFILSSGRYTWPFLHYLRLTIPTPPCPSSCVLTAVSYSLGL